MTISVDTRQAAQDLWSIGERYGRDPDPLRGSDLSEHDPLESQDDPLGSQDATVIELSGVPAITVSFFDDLGDTVTVDNLLAFDVPRRDTLALVESVLDGKARQRRAGGKDTRWSILRTLVLAPFLPYPAPVGTVVVVPVPGGATYEQPIPYQPVGGSGWLARLPRLP